MSRKTRPVGQALRQECRDLRYLLVYRDLSSISDEELLALTRRAARAYDQLDLLLDMSKRDARLRIFTASGGVASFVIGIATTGGLLSVLGVAIGGLGVGEGLFSLSRTKLQTITDEQFFETLSNLQAALERECVLRGFKPNGGA